MRWQVAATETLLLFCGIQSENNEKNIQRYKRTSHSPCTLLFTRIASAIAIAPLSPMLLKDCEPFRARKQNKTETSAKQK